MDVKNLIACPGCDLIHHRFQLPVRTTAYCRRCRTPLYSSRPISFDRPLALALCGIIAFTIANFYPFLTLKMEGRAEETILLSGVASLYQQGRLALAGLVLFTGFVCPLVQLGGLIYVLTPLRFGIAPPHLALVFRWVARIETWAMLEIFFLGTLVSVIKLAHMASIVPGVALFAFMMLIFIVPAAMAGLDSESVWQSLPIQMNR